MGDYMPVIILGAVIGLVLWKRGYLYLPALRPTAQAARPLVNDVQLGPRKIRYIEDAELLEVDTHRLGHAYLARLRREVQDKQASAKLLEITEQIRRDLESPKPGSPSPKAESPAPRTS